MSAMADPQQAPVRVTPTSLFHLAIPATDLVAAKQFYTQYLGCKLGRESARAVILDFFGHQVVLHAHDEPSTPQQGIYPRHFGLIFASWGAWESFIGHLQSSQQVSFYIAPRQRFLGQVTEHWSCFLADPSQNLLEFKYYTHPEAIFGARECAEVGDLP